MRWGSAAPADGSRSTRTAVTRTWWWRATASTPRCMTGTLRPLDGPALEPHAPHVVGLRGAPPPRLLARASLSRSPRHARSQRQLHPSLGLQPATGKFLKRLAQARRPVQQHRCSASASRPGQAQDVQRLDRHHPDHAKAHARHLNVPRRLHRRTEPPGPELIAMLLEEKNAVIYGAAGSIGGAVARAFAAEGATVHLAGRTLDGLEKVARGDPLGGGPGRDGAGRRARRAGGRRARRRRGRRGRRHRHLHERDLASVRSTARRWPRWRSRTSRAR